MLINRGFIAEHKTTSLLHNVSKLLLTKALAEETNPNPNPSEVATPPVNFEQLIERARKEEKDKLYPRIKKLEEDNKALITSSNANLLRIAELQKENEELKSKSDNAESDKVKDLETKLAEAKTEIETLKKSTPDEKVLREQIEKEYEIKLYKTTALSEHKDEILSVFTQDIKGSTKEEIDSAIASAKEKSLNLKKEMGLVDEDGNPISLPNKKGKKKEDSSDEDKNKKKKATTPTVNPADFDGESIDFDYVQSLDPTSKEYAEFRKKLGLK